MLTLFAITCEEHKPSGRLSDPFMSWAFDVAPPLLIYGVHHVHEVGTVLAFFLPLLSFQWQLSALAHENSVITRRM